MDYTKTYVKVTSQEEQTKAIEFYKGKGIEFSGLSGFTLGDPTAYIRRRLRNNTFSDYSNEGDATIDITEEVLGSKDHKDDYKDTYILTENNLERTNLAIGFYKSKGFYYEDRDSEDKENADFVSTNKTDIYLDKNGGDRNITEVFNQWIKQSEKQIPENTAIRIESEREFNLIRPILFKKGIGVTWREKDKYCDFQNNSYDIGFHLDKDDWQYLYKDQSKEEYKNISFDEAIKILGEDIPPKEEEPLMTATEACMKHENKHPNHGCGYLGSTFYQGQRPTIDRFPIDIPSSPYGIGIYELTAALQKQYDSLLNSKQPTKMTSPINADLFERFIKGTKTQVLDSVERAENSIEERDDLIKTIGGFYTDYKDSKESLERAYNQQDKQSIKKYLKEVQSKEDILKDELFQKQLFPVIKSINKLLEKKSK